MLSCRKWKGVPSPLLQPLTEPHLGAGLKLHFAAIIEWLLHLHPLGYQKSNWDCFPALEEPRDFRV